MSQKFGEKLRKIRVERGKTLEQVAEAIGSSKAYIWQLENKKNAKPSAEILLKLANFFGISADFMLDDTVNEYTNDQRLEAFYRKFNQLSEEDKRMIDRVMTGLDGNKE